MERSAPACVSRPASAVISHPPGDASVGGEAALGGPDDPGPDDRSDRTTDVVGVADPDVAIEALSRGGVGLLQTGVHEQRRAAETVLQEVAEVRRAHRDVAASGVSVERLDTV